MSEMSVRLFGCLCLFLASAALGGLGFAVASTPSSISDAIVAPATPELLGPIEETGRAGWACVPEHRAEAKGWEAAHLPLETTK